MPEYLAVVQLRIGRLSLIAALLLSASSAHASHIETVELPKELKTFVDRGTRPIEIERADLNGDGLRDYLLVLEQRWAPEGDRVGLKRSLLIIVRRAGGGLRLANRSDTAVRNDYCGGVWGDCFQGVTASKRTFTISEYGGSSWRWDRETTFRYSTRDHTWQLVRVEEQSFHVERPDKIRRLLYRRPRDFGKIDVSKYDADDFLGKGAR